MKSSLGGAIDPDWKNLTHGECKFDVSTKFVQFIQRDRGWLLRVMTGHADMSLGGCRRPKTGGYRRCQKRFSFVIYQNKITV